MSSEHEIGQNHLRKPATGCFYIIVRRHQKETLDDLPVDFFRSGAIKVSTYASLRYMPH